MYLFMYVGTLQIHAEVTERCLNIKHLPLSISTQLSETGSLTEFGA